MHQPQLAGGLPVAGVVERENADRHGQRQNPVAPHRRLEDRGGRFLVVKEGQWPGQQHDQRRYDDHQRYEPSEDRPHDILDRPPVLLAVGHAEHHARDGYHAEGHRPEEAQQRVVGREGRKPFHAGVPQDEIVQRDAAHKLVAQYHRPGRADLQDRAEFPPVQPAKGEGHRQRGPPAEIVTGLDGQEHPHARGRTQREPKHAHVQRANEKQVRKQGRNDTGQRGQSRQPGAVLQGKIGSQLAADHHRYDADRLAQQVLIEQQPHRAIVCDEPRKIEERHEEIADDDRCRHQQRCNHIQREGIADPVIGPLAQVFPVQYGCPAHKQRAYSVDQHAQGHIEPDGSHGFHTQHIAGKKTGCDAVDRADRGKEYLRRQQAKHKPRNQSPVLRILLHTSTPLQIRINRIQSCQNYYCKHASQGHFGDRPCERVHSWWCDLLQGTFSPRLNRYKSSSFPSGFQE